VGCRGVALDAAFGVEAADGSCQMHLVAVGDEEGDAALVARCGLSALNKLGTIYDRNNPYYSNNRSIKFDQIEPYDARTTCTFTAVINLS
jgi:hypothetical protein